MDRLNNRVQTERLWASWCLTLSMVGAMACDARCPATHRRHDYDASRPRYFRAIGGFLLTTEPACAGGPPVPRNVRVDGLVSAHGAAHAVDVDCRCSGLHRPGRHADGWTGLRHTAVHRDRHPNALVDPSGDAGSGRARPAHDRRRVSDASHPARTTRVQPVRRRSRHYVEERAPAGNWQLRHARLDTSAMEGLVEQAVAVLRDARESYDDVLASEVSRHDPWTRFDVRTPELRKSVSVYALGERDDEAPSRAVRARLNSLRERLLGFRREVDAGNALDLGEYAPEAFLVKLVDAPDELAGEIHWPWPTLGVDDFAQTDRGVFARVMSAIELGGVLPFADGAYLIATAPSGHRYVIYLTPLLPGEPTL